MSRLITLPDTPLTIEHSPSTDSVLVFAHRVAEDQCLEVRVGDLPALIEALTQLRDELQDPCPYTFAHTRHWCGHALCRDS